MASPVAVAGHLIVPGESLLYAENISTRLAIGWTLATQVSARLADRRNRSVYARPGPDRDGCRAERIKR